MKVPVNSNCSVSSPSAQPRAAAVTAPAEHHSTSADAPMASRTGRST
jgi:hypothetical protein